MQIAGMDYQSATPGAQTVLRIDSIGAHITCLPSRSKLSTESKVLPRGTDLCPVLALELWIANASINRGPVVPAMSPCGIISLERLVPSSLINIIKRAIVEAGLKSGLSLKEAKLNARPYTSGSLRLGFIMSAMEADVSRERIAIHLGLKTTLMIDRHRLRNPIPRTNPLRDIMS